MNNYEFCANYISKLGTKKQQPVTALDYGCEAGQIVTLLSGYGIDAKGCDIFYAGGDYSNHVPAELLGVTIKSIVKGVIPFEDNSFDYVVNNQVFEHVEDIDHVLAEIYRVLKPGGLVLSLFPDKGVWREGHCGIPFLHWFPKGSKRRIYYAALLRTFGMGYFKSNKSILQWSRDFCDWLDQWTYYRSYSEICTAFNKDFIDLKHIEEIWLQERFGTRATVLTGWLPKPTRRWIVNKLGGLVFVCDKAGD
jgi:SAM-dependent methyltransferase